MDSRVKKVVALISGDPHNNNMMIKKGNEMTKFAVYQVPFENDLIRDVGFMSAEAIELVSDQYELVGYVDAVDLEQVFFYGNMQREKFTVVGDMVSVSTGNIIHNLDTDETFVVENYGFKKINMKEVA